MSLPSKLVFPASLYARFRVVAFEDAPLETAAFVLAAPVKAPDGFWRLIVRDVIFAEDSDYTLRTETRVKLRPDAVARAVQQARFEGLSVILAHTHPCGTTGPSEHDLSGEAVLLPTLRRRVPDAPHGRLILWPDGLHAALFDLDGNTVPLDVHVVGREVQVFSSEGTLPKAQLDVYHRQALALGEIGQRRLRYLTFGIVAAGGTGSLVAQQLAHLGVTNVKLIDFDLVEGTNLNRLVGSQPSDVDRPKVDVTHDLMMRVNPAATVEALRADVTFTDVARELLDVDFAFICTDSHGSRAVLSQLAYQYLLPMINLGVGIHADASGLQMVGTVHMLAPGLACLSCSGDIHPAKAREDLLTEAQRQADPYVTGVQVPQPAVISINSVVAGLAVTMMLGALTDLPVAPRRQVVRFHDGVVRAAENKATRTCPVCSASENMLFARGDTWPRPGRME